MATLYRFSNAAHSLRNKTSSFVAFSKYHAKSINFTTTPVANAGKSAVAAVAMATTTSKKSTSDAVAVPIVNAAEYQFSKRNFGYSHRIFNNLSMNNNKLLYKPSQMQEQQIRSFSSLEKHLKSLPSTIESVSQFTNQNAMITTAAAPAATGSHKVSSREITKNMTLFTSKQFKSEVDPKTLEFKSPSGNPLVLLMSWLMAKQKHLRKYAELYTEMGFDVMVIHVTPWQLLWPVKGTQMVAADTLKFLENNPSYKTIVLHGFSVGAYQFGEVMLQMARDMERYNPILERFVSQIWDSAADITEIPVGLPKSIFPKNPRMQSALRNYTLYHMRTFHNQATVHYMRSSQMFHSTLLKTPALFFVSENDLIGPPSSNQSVRDDWERANVKCTFKCWEHSQHAAHFMKHRQEYLEMLYKHLDECGVFESIGIKSRAKL